MDTSEEIEAAVDVSPQEFDFLGKAIDTGFRVAKHSSYDSCSVSVQLAYALSKGSERKSFRYHVEFSGREVLKGVNGDTPYPKLHIDTETRPDRMQLRASERLLSGWSSTQPQPLLSFLERFMANVGMEAPRLPFRDGEPIADGVAPSYVEFEQMYSAAQTEARQRDAAFAEAAEQPDSPNDDADIPDMSEELSGTSGGGGST